MPEILDGNRVRDEIKAELKPRISTLTDKGRPPGLAVVLVGSNPASEIYVRNKVKTCEDLGIHSETLRPPESPRSVSPTASFRVAGKAPELWWPDTGRLERAAVFQESNGRTSVGLTLGPSGSVFVVFRKPLASAIAATRLIHDGETVLSATPGSEPKVRIERATYGVPGSPDQTRDVRQKVQQKADAGEHNFLVSSLAEGDDPAPNVLKTLVVDRSEEH